MALVSLDQVSVSRAGHAVLREINLSLAAGDRIFLRGENGAGKSSLILLIAGRLHPYNNLGTRSYAWDSSVGMDFRNTRKYIGLVSREEQHRLLAIHGKSSVTEFLLGHLDGQDFIYRDIFPAERNLVDQTLEQFRLGALASRLLRTLSVGEMRLALVARAGMHSRKIYLLDEIFSGLSEQVAQRITDWIRHLPHEAAVIMTGHAEEYLQNLNFTGQYMVEGGSLRFSQVNPLGHGIRKSARKINPQRGDLLIDAENADFYHDFTRIFEKLSFQIRGGDRVLVTGANGSGKTTLLRIMHGDFYPAWQQGRLQFLGRLQHEQKMELWSRVQLVSAAHFSYYPLQMRAIDVLASRYSGSIYEYPEKLPTSADPIIAEFSLGDFLDRSFAKLSEGEKTRILLARAFLLPAPVYLIDEGFMALSANYFARAIGYLNALPGEAVVVIAANERIQELRDILEITPQEWHISAGRLATPP